MMKRFFAITAVLASFAVPAHADTAISFATDWKAQAEHGGFYQAIAKGYYTARGLDVTIRPGGPQTDLPRLIAAGAIDIGMASNNFQPINMVAAGADVKVVMTSFQKDPQMFMVHPEVQADSLADLKGMPIFLADSAIGSFWPWFKQRFGYEDSQIRKYTYSLAPWLVNRNSVQEGYFSSEPFSAEQAGVKPKVFLFADAGYPGYAGMVMVRAAYIRDHPDVVRAFVAASIEGWQDYIWGDPAPGNALILKHNPEMTPELIAFGLGQMKAQGMLGERETVGHMTDARWQSFYGEMAELDVVEKGLDVKQVYTLDFLPGNAAGASN